MLLFSFSGQVLSLAENPTIPDGSRALPDTHLGRNEACDSWRSAALPKGLAAKATFTCAVRVVFSICQDSSFFLGMDKHIKQKRKKNLKRKLLPSDSAIDKGKGH